MPTSNYPKRKNLRLPRYDYSQNGAYFITICTKDREPLLGGIVGAAVPILGTYPGSPHIDYSHYGKIVYIANIPLHYHHVSVPVYCVMPNHIHLIILINMPLAGPPGYVPRMGTAAPTSSIPQIVNSLKTLATKEAGIPLWQRGYYEHIIRCEQDYLDIWQYIETNPVKWAEDRYYQR